MTPTTAGATPAGLTSAVDVGDILSLGLPAGWKVKRSELYRGSGFICLVPPGEHIVIFDCTGIAIYFGAHLPGAEMSVYHQNQGAGWYHATDVEPCPFLKNDTGNPMVGLRMQPGFKEGLKPVGAHRAYWNKWTASCAGHTFHPQAWFLPASKVVIFDYLEHPQTAAVLAAAKFAVDGESFWDSPKYVTGHLISATGTTITVQPFHTYTTGAAGKAYAEAHGLEYPFPNDYYDANVGPKRTFHLSAGTYCEGGTAMGKPIANGPVPCSAFATAPKGMPVAVWDLPTGSSVESVSEIFRP